MEVYELKPMTPSEMAAYELEMLESERRQRKQVYDLETHRREWR